MPFDRRFSIAAMATAVLFVVSACSPLVNLPGKQVSEPKIESEHFVAVDGSKLPVRAWLPQNGAVKAAVVALHGFNDYSNFFTVPGSYLSRSGVASYAYDQRGFGGAPGRGLWPGIEAYVNDLGGFVKEIRKRHPGVPLYVLGESMGGAVTIVAMTEKDTPDVDGVILVAPAVWGRETMPWYQRWLLALTSHTLPWLEVTGKGMGVVASDNAEMLRSLSRDPLVIKKTRIDTVYGLANLMDEALSRAEKIRLPVLVQYGAHDQVIPPKPVFLMLEKMPATTRKAFYRNGYHMLLRDLQGGSPLSDIAAWIADRTGPLPCGTENWK